MRNGGGRGGPSLAVSTVRRVHSVVRAALEQGVRWGCLQGEPGGPRLAGAWTGPRDPPAGPEAVLALLQRAEQDDKAFAVLLVLPAVSGARRGELVALRWSDLDLESGALTITRAISEGVVDGPIEHPRPKTRGSVRRLPLDEATVAVLAAHRCRQAEACRLLALPAARRPQRCRSARQAALVLADAGT